MQISFYPKEKLISDLKRVVGKYLDTKNYHLFFFGSRVSGKGNERSDIDVGLEGPTPVPWNILGKIREDLDEIPTLYKIELIDFGHADTDFKKVAKQSIEPID